MANETISQATPEIKSQGMNGVISQLRQSPRDIDHLAAEILDGDQSKAMDYLGMFGFRSFLDGTDYCPASTLAEFYGVNPGYLVRTLNSRGLSHTKTPGDIELLRDIKLPNYQQSLERDLTPGRNYQTVLVLRNTKRMGSSPFTRTTGGSPNAIQIPIYPGVKNVPVLSAAVALASVPLMFFGRKIPMRSKAEEILNALRGSSYYRAAEERAVVQQAVQEPVQEESTVPPEGARLNETGEIVFTPEFFATLFKNMSKEIVEAIRSSNGSSVPAQAPKPKQPVIQDQPTTNQRVQYVHRDGQWLPARTKPKAWDELAAKYSAREITRKEFAAAAGVPAEQMYYYLTKWGRGKVPVSTST